MRKILIGTMALLSFVTFVNCQKETIEEVEEILDGSQIHRGSTIPANSDYKIGDYYFNEKTAELYGPKTAEGWGSPIKFGKEQTDNSKIYSGTGAPEISKGTEGDWYIDLESRKLYGPKSQNNWGTGIVLGGSSFAGTNQDSDAILPNYLLSDDGLTLLVWANTKSQIIDMTQDTKLKKVEKINDEAFSRKRALTKVIFGENVQEIGTSAFEHDFYLTSVVFNNAGNLKIIGEEAFTNCISLKEMQLPKGLTGIAKHAFLNCKKLESVIVPSTCENVGTGAFLQCIELKNITINEGVKYIHNEVFEKCTSLEKVTFPASIKGVGPYLFKDSSVKEVVFLGDVPSESVANDDENYFSNAFDSSTVERILVPSQYLAKYQEALSGTKYEDKVQAK